MVLVTARSAWQDFDSEWYRYTYPETDDAIAAGRFKTPFDVYASHVKPLEHSPNPFFSESWYLSRYNDIRQAVANGTFVSGFDQFCRDGHTYRTPHWLFDPGYYQAEFRRANGREFDPQLDGDPYGHFLRIGQHQGLTGHWLFDATVYRAGAGYDVASRIDKYGPFTTFLLHIGADSKEPAVSLFFDPVWYRARYPQVDRDIADRKWSCALHHYLATPDPIAFDPSPQFSERVYRACAPDVSAAVAGGVFRSGFHHFALHGRSEGRFYASSAADCAGGAAATRPACVTGNFPLQTRTFEKVTLLPCKVESEDPWHATFGVLGHNRDTLPQFEHSWLTMQTSDETAEPIGGAFIYGGVLTSHFGHILRDGLASLWFIRQHPELPVLWHWLDLPVSHSLWPEWLDELWRLLGLDSHVHLRITAPITVDQVILPEPALMAKNVLHKTQARAFATVKPSTDWIGNRVWLSRSRLPEKFGRFEHEAEVETILATRGWNIHHPEEQTVAEQVGVFATAAVVAGSIGSAFHGVLLSTSPRAKLILVRRPGIEQTFFDAVAQALELDQYYLEPELEAFTESHSWADFTLANPRGLADSVCRLADMIQE